MREIVQLTVIIDVSRKADLQLARAAEPHSEAKLEKKIGYDVSVRPSVRTDWQGGTKWTMRGIQDMQIAFVLAKQQAVHLEAAKCGANVPLTLNENESGI